MTNEKGKYYIMELSIKNAKQGRCHTEALEV